MGARSVTEITEVIGLCNPGFSQAPQDLGLRAFFPRECIGSALLSLTMVSIFLSLL